MRAAIYARYSSDNQRDASIEDQVRECRARLEHEGWELANVYSDRGISGATILRPAYQQLLEDMRRGHFEVIVTEALDRLSRDQENVAALYKQASFADVKVFTLAEGEISELHVGLSASPRRPIAGLRDEFARDAPAVVSAMATTSSRAARMIVANAA